MADYDFDLFIIGAGSGGVRAGRIAAGYGARVAVAEEFRVGGTCVIRGCVPKKLLVYASAYAESFADAAGYGWTVAPPAFDWATLLANKDREIERLSRAYTANLEKAGAAILKDRAEVLGPHEIRLVGAGQRVTAATILVATGAHPRLPPDVVGGELAITSNEAFHLERLPERIAIVGGGYVAVEFAGIFNGLGVETTILYRGEQVLRGFDEDLRAALAREMRKKGVDVRTRTDIVEIHATAEGGRRLLLTTGEELEVGAVMMATGRVPNTAGLGLAAAGVALEPSGAVIVDRYSRSSVPSIYAVGDVTNRLQLTPAAIREGHAFADTVFGGRDVPIEHRLIPTAVFSQPEVGTVGLTEDQALGQCGEVDIYRTEFRPMRHTLSGRDERTLMKLIVDRRTDRVLGVHILGADAGEMIQLAGVALGMGATKADFDRTLAVHPTAAEELVTMRTPSVRHGIDKGT